MGRPAIWAAGDIGPRYWNASACDVPVRPVDFVAAHREGLARHAYLSLGGSDVVAGVQ
jgi:hypothetical protein